MKKKKLPKIHPADIPECDYLCWQVWLKAQRDYSGVPFNPAKHAHCLAYSTFLMGWVAATTMHLGMIEDGKPSLDEIRMWANTSRAEAVVHLDKYKALIEAFNAASRN